MREQAARAEAERVTDLVGRVTRLVDAALTSGTLDEILSTLVQEVRGVLEADSATIMLTEQDERLSVSVVERRQPPASTRDEPPETIALGEVLPAAWPARARRCSSTALRPPTCPTRVRSGGPWIP